jgi:hypothetical protein
MDRISRLILLREVIIALDTCVIPVGSTDQFRGCNLSDCLPQVSFLLKVEHEYSGSWRDAEFWFYPSAAIKYAARDLLSSSAHCTPSL